MTFENHTKGEFHEKNTVENDLDTPGKGKKAGAKDPESDQGKKAGHPDETVGYTGGQPLDDSRGLDISQYIGPDSKVSSDFKDPKAPYHQGPGSGLTKEEEKRRDEESGE